VYTTHFIVFFKEIYWGFVLDLNAKRRKALSRSARPHCGGLRLAWKFSAISSVKSERHSDLTSDYTKQSRNGMTYVWQNFHASQ
jgi:hypothetical protein